MVHGVYKVVPLSSFGVTRRHMVSGGGIAHFATASQFGIQTLGSSSRTGAFCPTPITAGYTTCSVIDRVRNLKFATYLKFATCENTNKINELW